MTDQYQEEDKKKKKRRQANMLFIDYNTLDDNEILSTLAEIQRKLKQIFRNHVGKANAIKSTELFQKVYGISPYAIDVYRREYWWNILKKILGIMRTQGLLFVINNHGKSLYVLQSLHELEDYKSACDKGISYLELRKRKAEIWVHNKMWMNL